MTQNFQCLKKYQDKNKINFFTPKLSFRYAPGHMRNIQDDDLKLSYSNAFLLNKNAEPDVIEEGESIATGFEISSYELDEGLRGDKNYSLSLAQIQSFKENTSIPSKSSLDQKHLILLAKLS